MKEQELRHHLNKLYGDVPEATHAAYMAALAPGKEATPMKKKLLYSPVLAIVLVLILATVAVAATTQVLEWYYANRFTNEQPAIRDAILSQAQPPLTQQQDENPSFDATVQEVSWATDAGRLVITMNVAPRDAAIELHPMWNLDPDGSYIGGDAPMGVTDGEDRGDHWLLTQKGFGPVKEMMLDPQKMLHLVDVRTPLLTAADGQTQIKIPLALDAFDTTDGSVQFILEYRLDDLSLANDAHYTPGSEQLIHREALRTAILQSGGKLSLTLPYFTVAYTEDDEVLYLTGQQPHFVALTIDIGSVPADLFD